MVRLLKAAKKYVGKSSAGSNKALTSGNTKFDLATEAESLPPSISGQEANDDSDDGMSYTSETEVMLNLDSDEELQLAFEKGLLKPGLNAFGVDSKKTYVNDEEALKTKLDSFKLDLAPLEVLSMTLKPAALAPELAIEEEEHAQKRLKMFESRAAKTVSKGRKPAKEISVDNDVVHNDFKREISFYRLAQAAVLEGLPKLKELGAKTKKPEDYFAEMAKSDDHMQRVRHKLLDEEQKAEDSAKARRLRQLKKFGKQTQIAVLQRRQEEKKQIMEQIKKFRKGQKDAINFLDKPGGPPAREPKELKRKQPVSTQGTRKKRAAKDKKYGFGGQKKRSKYNTKESTDDVGGYIPLSKGKIGHRSSSFRGAASNPRQRMNIKPGKGVNKRPGKTKRKQMKQGSKKR